MQFRRYISTFIIILTLLGVVNEQQTTTPNQEIVLQFVDVDTTSNYAQETIARVTEQLQGLGVENIKISELGNNLKITYYSEKDVSSIEDLLSVDHTITFDHTPGNKSSFPLDKEQIAYNLDVYELQETSTNDWSFEGHVLQVKTDSDRLSNPNVFTFINLIDAEEAREYYKVAFKINKAIALEIDNTSYKIPEVRAGPIY